MEVLDMEFRLRIKELREDKGISQAAFAKKIGAAQSTVGSWECGTREPGFETLIKIADFFGVSLDYLLCRTDIRDGHIITAPAELVDVGVVEVEKAGSDALTEEEIAAIRAMLKKQRK